MHALGSAQMPSKAHLHHIEQYINVTIKLHEPFSEHWHLYLFFLWGYFLKGVGVYFTSTMKLIQINSWLTCPACSIFFYCPLHPIHQIHPNTKHIHTCHFMSSHLHTVIFLTVVLAHLAGTHCHPNSSLVEAQILSYLSEPSGCVCSDLFDQGQWNQTQIKV